MTLVTPDHTQAAWELGSAALCAMNVMAVRRSRSISGVHWLPTAYFTGWGLYNLWFYAALNLPTAWWAGLAITVVNSVWLGHVAYYSFTRVRDARTCQHGYEDWDYCPVCCH